MVAVQPTTRIEAKCQTVMTKALIFGFDRFPRTQPRMLVVKINVEYQTIHHNEQVEGGDHTRDASINEHDRSMEGADHELHDLYLRNPCSSEEWGTVRSNKVEHVIQIDYDLACGMNDGWETSVSTAGKAARHKPAQKVQQAQVHVHQGDPLKLLTKDHEEGIKKIQLSAMVLVPDEHSKTVSHL
mmetsp:Transcript_28513/g.51931  ORF Transcript_28513/g.51931 Transcript_28513/m.51931 type:complete len:185 (-) Transcript_28513:543-1097(-)